MKIRSPQSEHIMNEHVDIDSILNNVAVDTVRRLTEANDNSNDLRMTTSGKDLEEELWHSGELLPEGFHPSPQSVIVGRGKEAKEHDGNKRLHLIVNDFLEQYSRAGNEKKAKSEIVSRIVDIVDSSCPDCQGFVKRTAGGRWYKVSNGAARDKVGCILRNTLSHKYRSSSKAKVARRKQARETSIDSLRQDELESKPAANPQPPYDFNSIATGRGVSSTFGSWYLSLFDLAGDEP